ncbi:YkgJ family cysteine cluster protein [Methanococcus voltae]|uniref:Fe-S-cluster containining protein n=1 Tax=Methanococcus voltae PS TaxID=523842 RepID=A0ABT2EUX3_METVO|nr:YkgJ family cysteine cluster protein [Methanococcus voltae]MBP2172065.1 Fe-S-cluster containining protein [Methanococcus voltae]MCS3921702.1 Fe-S-cluster containining protein [Methanococcus voltae PS]
MTNSNPDSNSNSNSNYKTEGISWSCRFCGGCCDSPSVTKKDIANIAGFLKITFEEVVSKYLKSWNGKNGVLKTSKTKCVFLGEDRKCTIYKVRPIICRLRPYSIQLIGKNKGGKKNKNSAELKLTYDPWFLENCKGMFLGDLPPEEEYFKHAITVYTYMGEEKVTPEELFEKAKKRLVKK